MKIGFTKNIILEVKPEIAEIIETALIFGALQLPYNDATYRYLKRVEEHSFGMFKAIKRNNQMFFIVVKRPLFYNKKKLGKKIKIELC